MYGTRHLHLDLGRGEFSTGPAAREFTAVAAGFEGAEVAARNVELVGTNGPDTLNLHGCNTSARGLSGDDRISYYYPQYDNWLPIPIACPSERARLFGGTGKDKLLGSRGRDDIIGGRGKDSADGWQGRDRCSAEKTLSCEAPSPG